MPNAVISDIQPSDVLQPYEAVRIAVQHMTPVILLSDGTSQWAEPWKFPKSDDLKPIEVKFKTSSVMEKKSFSLSAWWKTGETVGNPRNKGLEHRIGGLEKQNITGNVNYEPENHQLMVKMPGKVDRIAQYIPDQQWTVVRKREITGTRMGFT